MVRPESWSRLTGGSPVRVGTGAPGSRPRFVVERRRAKRGVKSLCGGSEHAGRSIKRTLQPRQGNNGGAEPFMSRRRPRPSGYGPVLAWRVLPGYGGARAHSLGRNRRGPSAQPASGKDRWYKPMVKSGGGRRESEGVVVPVIGVQQNAPGGEGPRFDHAGGEGKREGMAGVARSNSPGRPGPAVAVDGDPSAAKARQLQRRLWAAAKQSSGRRFHALYDRIHRGDVLWEAWYRVCKNRGAAGVDRITLAFVQEQYGVERLLAELQADLRAGVYRPAPARRVDIPKPQGGKRPLGIPTEPANCAGAQAA